MFDAQIIKKLFAALNEELKAADVKGEIGLCGGAVMCLVFQARKATKDLDGIFEPTAEIRKAAQKVAKKFGLEPSWLNDATKGYFRATPPRQEIMELSHLRIWAPGADYMLAMKCVSARFDTHDKADVAFLINHLGLKKPEDVFDIIEKYYPKNQIPAKARFLVEEILATTPSFSS